MTPELEPKSIPFCIAVIGTPAERRLERGYPIYPDQIKYDPSTQLSDMICGGDSEPTTWSSVSSTGIVNSDADDGEDDTGKD